MARSILIHLLSNDTSTYKLNTPSRFQNLLDEKIDLPQGSRISLLEASYCNALIANDSNAFLDIYSWEVNRGDGYFGQKTTIHLGKEKFTSPDSLTGLLNAHIYDACPSLRKRRFKVFTFDPSLNRIWFCIDSNCWFTLKLRGKFINILGVETKPATLRSYVVLGRTKKGDTFQFHGKTVRFAPDFRENLISSCAETNFFAFPPSLHDDIHSMIVYCDLIENSKIANTQSPILRILPYRPTKNAETIFLNFSSNPLYIRPKNSAFQTVSIEIRDIFGNEIPLSGFTRITLEVILPP